MNFSFPYFIYVHYFTFLILVHIPKIVQYLYIWTRWRERDLAC
nr:MAG TPA: hypothetical protein [Caudoviricetes sp.]